MSETKTGSDARTSMVLGNVRRETAKETSTGEMERDSQLRKRKGEHGCTSLKMLSHCLIDDASFTWSLIKIRF